MRFHVPSGRFVPDIDIASHAIFSHTVWIFRIRFHRRIPIYSAISLVIYYSRERFANACDYVRHMSARTRTRMYSKHYLIVCIRVLNAYILFLREIWIFVWGSVFMNFGGYSNNFSCLLNNLSMIRLKTPGLISNIQNFYKISLKIMKERW